MSDGFVTALEPLYVDGVLAHNKGDQVPVDNVDRNGWKDKTSKPRKPSANAAQQDQ